MEEIKSKLCCEIKKHINNLNTVNSKELGEVIDMIKDLSESIYYDTIVESMHNKKEEATVDEMLEALYEHSGKMTIQEKNTLRQKIIDLANRVV